MFIWCAGQCSVCCHRGRYRIVVSFKPQRLHVLHPQTNSLHIYKDPVPPLALNSIIFQKGSVKQKWICRKLQMCASFFMNTWRQRGRMKSGESRKAGEWWGMRGRRLQQWEMISIATGTLLLFSPSVVVTLWKECICFVIHEFVSGKQALMWSFKK